MKIDQLPDHKPEILALDIETTNKRGFSDPYIDDIRIISICDGNETYVLTKNFNYLQPWVDGPDVLLLIHNGAFDIRFLRRIGMHPTNIWDTLMVERVLTAGTNKGCKLDEVCERRLKLKLDKTVRERGFNNSDLTLEQLTYAAKDTTILFPIYGAQRIEVGLEDLGKVVAIENDVVPVVAEMELTGIGFDQDAWNIIKTREIELRDEAYKQVILDLRLPYQLDLFGRVNGINLNSHEVLKKSLLKRGIKLENTQAETIENYYHRHPKLTILQHLLDYKEHDKAIGFDYPSFVHPITGRIHTDFNQMGADTARFTSSNPNLQQVKRLKEFRRIFIAEKGKYIITADYSQLQLRLMAEVSNCRNLLSAFEEGRDPHNELAISAFGANGSGKHPKRQEAKNTNFAEIFGAGPEKLAVTIGIPLSEARKLDKGFKTLNPEIEDWGGARFSELCATGVSVDPIFKRKRWFPEILELGPAEVWKYRNIARNTPIQNIEASIVKVAMRKLFDVGLFPVLQAHDEIAVETSDPSRVDEVRQIMITAGEPYLKKVKLDVGVTIDYCWTK